MQLPDLVHRKEQNHDILDDVWDRTSEEPLDVRHAVAVLYRGCVGLLYGNALEDCDEDGGDVPGYDECADNVHADLHESRGEDAHVHGEDGQFEGEEEVEVEVLGYPEVLTVLGSTWAKDVTDRGEVTHE